MMPADAHVHAKNPGLNSEVEKALSLATVRPFSPSSLDTTAPRPYGQFATVA
jgi:hypothetical protein